MISKLTSPSFNSNRKYRAVPLSPISGGNSEVTIPLPSGGRDSIGEESFRSLPRPVLSPYERTSACMVPVSLRSSSLPQGWKSSIQVSTSFRAKAFWIMLFAVSRNDMGKFPAVKTPKKQRNNAAIVLFRAPVLPMIFNTNFGIHCACLRNSISGVRKVNANRTRITSFGAGGVFVIE